MLISGHDVIWWITRTRGLFFISDLKKGSQCVRIRYKGTFMLLFFFCDLTREMPPEDWWNSSNNIFVLVTVVNDELIYGMEMFNWPNNYRRSPVFFTDCNILLTYEAILGLVKTLQSWHLCRHKQVSLKHFLKYMARNLILQIKRRNICDCSLLTKLFYLKAIISLSLIDDLESMKKLLHTL